MPLNRSLTYLSAKSVLQFLDPNLRIELRQRCPGIRSTERIVPMRVDELQLTPTMIRINQKKYRLCLYECYWDSLEKIPEGILNKRKLSRERDHDVDQYGIRDESIDLISGDQNIDFIRRLRKDIDIEQLRDMYYKSIDQLSIEKDPVEMKALEESVDHYGSIYYPYLLREKETAIEQIPYFYCIKLTVGDKMEMIQYNKKLGDALKYYLVKKIIVGPLTIRNLEINPIAPFHYKLHNNLSVCNLKITEQAEKALNAFSFTSPLKELEVTTHIDEIINFSNRTIRKTALYSNPTLRESKFLILNGNPILNDFGQITNSRVLFLEPDTTYFYIRAVSKIVENWKRDPPVIGTHFEFKVSHNFSESSFFYGIECLPGAEKGRLPEERYMLCRQCLDIKLNNDLEVTVFIETWEKINLVVQRKQSSMTSLVSIQK